MASFGKIRNGVVAKFKVLCIFVLAWCWFFATFLSLRTLAASSELYLNKMEITEIFERKITRIFEIYKPEPYGLDNCEIFLELDNEIIIDIPWNESDDIWEKELLNEAKRIISGIEKVINNKIIAYISYYNEPTDKAFLELENGVIITEQNFAPNGTGIVGLQIYDSIKDMERRFGEKYTRISFDKKASC
jgi:hypothetical protein